MVRKDRSVQGVDEAGSVFRRVPFLDGNRPPVDLTLEEVSDPQGGLSGRRVPAQTDHAVSVVAEHPQEKPVHHE